MSASHPLDLLVQSLSLRVPLSGTARDAILALPFTFRSLESSTYIVREGQPPEQCGVLVSGFAYRQKTTCEGARQIIALHLPGDAVDFQHLFLSISDHSVQMLTAGEVAFVPRSALQALVRSDPEVAKAIYTQIAVEASIFREWVLNVGRRQARERIAHVLCELGSRLDALGLAKRYGYELPLTQEQIGDAVGLTQVHVNRTLKEMTDEGLICRDKRRISFPDWRRMCEIAGFNERYLHMQPQMVG
ncbi:Crp/Fnr family transcriptional regulator [Alteripontixanthobacter muriae]|uniref:Crp/Fnr family transcriptional regulator n=1 Tax=Alteripontixanthobacter muriae TaxID=2705546 RepID=UPI001E5F9BA4|nr:Crp/Fnr family transcriptional regulator [Alteripontixanthobacter muriae]